VERPGDHRRQQRAGTAAITIIPVVHSEGSGSTAQFTSWLASQFPAMWQSYAKAVRLTEYYPNNVHGMVQRNGPTA